MLYPSLGLKRGHRKKVKFNAEKWLSSGGISGINDSWGERFRGETLKSHLTVLG
jgi:hypothetical protein